jgi:hypothetical protein
MPYIPTEWEDEILASVPAKYRIVAADGTILNDAVIELLTEVTPGTSMNAANFNKLESAIQQAVALAEQAVANTLTPAQVVDAIWKVGDLYTSTSPISPAIKYGVGTWEAYGAGRVFVGIDPNDEDFDTVGKEGGEKAHPLTVDENGPHTHSESKDTGIQQVESGTQPSRYPSNGTGTTGSSGLGTPHNNLQPFTVVYAWRRIA